MIINKKYLAEFSPLPKNYNYDEVMLYVPVAEKIWLRPLVGDDLVDELQEQVDNNNLSEENSTLLTEGGLWQYLCYATCYEALPFITYHFSEVGATKGKSENSDSIDLKELSYIQNHLRAQTEILKDQLKKWLCSHSGQFPLVDCCACGCDCCEDFGKLNKPNPYQQMYSPRQKCVDLK